MRRALGIVLGVAAAMAIIALVEAAIQMLYPFPQSIETLDRTELAALVAGVPLPAKLMVVAGWFAGTFGGGWLALRICDWRWAAWIVTALVIAAGVANQIVLPHPLWMQAASVLTPLAGAWLALRMHHKPSG